MPLSFFCWVWGLRCSGTPNSVLKDSLLFDLSAAVSQEQMAPFPVPCLLLLVFLWLPFPTRSMSRLCSQQYLDLMGLGTCLF